PFGEIGRGEGVRDDRYGEGFARAGAHGQADPVDGDRALVDDEGSEPARDRHAEGPAFAGRVEGGDLPHAVDVAEHEVPADPIADPKGSLEVQEVPLAEPSE